MTPVAAISTLYHDDLTWIIGSFTLVTIGIV